MFLDVSLLSPCGSPILCLHLGCALFPPSLRCPASQPCSASLAFLGALAPWLSLSRPPRVRLCEVLLPRRGASRNQRPARQPDYAGEWPPLPHRRGWGGAEAQRGREPRRAPPTSPPRPPPRPRTSCQTVPTVRRSQPSQEKEGIISIPVSQTRTPKPRDVKELDYP